MSDGRRTNRKGHPWRDNIEAVTMAIVMAVLLKYFVVEAYRIPTGSMQPTLMGNDETGIYDRILVDKFSYHYRDPKRFEVAVFKYPLDRSKNFIKRIWGMPGEELRIAHGDVWRRAAPTDEWEPVRRPRSVQGETWKRLDTEGDWAFETGGDGWRAEGAAVVATGPGSARFPHAGSVMDDYADGYPGQMASKFHRRGGRSGENPVGDLRIACEVEVDADCPGVELAFFEGSRSYRMLFPGPAAPEGARPAIEVSDPRGEIASARIEAERPWHLRAGRRAAIAAQNLDDLLELEIEGEVLASSEVPPVSREACAAELRSSGGHASFEDLEVFRDIYYTTDGVKQSPEWQIPAGCYFMLGDNTQDSEDSRAWTLTGFRVVDGERAGFEVHGNLRRRENPQRVTGGPDGTEIFFEDVQGERYRFLQSEVEPLEPVLAPLVPRHLITGRALLVFWPIVPSLDVVRLKWVR